MAKALIIKKLIKALDMNTVQFEKEIEVSNSTVSKAIARESDISDNLIRKILKKYPNVNERWLETGQGEIFKQPADIEPQLQEPQPTTAAAQDSTPMEQDYRTRYEKALE